MARLGNVRLAVRTLAQAPARSLLVILAIAIGIGANTAVFSFVSAVILKPLPLPHIDRLVTIWETEPSRDELAREVSYPEFLQWRARARGVEGMLAMSSVNLAFTWQRREGPESIRGRVVSEDFFSVLGVQPAVGRSFRPEETTASPAVRAVVLSDEPVRTSATSWRPGTTAADVNTKSVSRWAPRGGRSCGSACWRAGCSRWRAVRQDWWLREPRLRH